VVVAGIDYFATPKQVEGRVQMPRMDGLDAGMDDFISKRVRIDDLERRLREALARSRNGESKT
jgi:DNA-binding response OmpR family regulator